MSIHSDLVEAFLGVYEEDYRKEYDLYVEKHKGELALPSYDYWVEDLARNSIRKSTNEERLDVYCQWNGIIGFSNRLYKIATGEWEN